jgi:hypothetical protein
LSAADGFCPKCGAAQAAVAGERELGWNELQQVYTLIFDASKIPPGQSQRFQSHGLRSTFPTAVAVLLHFLTIGIFTVIFHGLKHSALPPIRHDDFRAGKAIGFLFIPFFNLYWQFVFWQRLADRINFQFRLRGLPDPVTRGLVTTSCVLTVIPYIGILNWLIIAPIVSGQIQSASNRLVEMEIRRRQAGV